MLQGLYPNKDQTRCLKCGDVSDGAISPRDLNGECVCAEGYRKIEIDNLGFSKNWIRCEKCPSNSYKGPPTRSIWQCEPCPDPNMEYKDNICSCKKDFYPAGDGCVREASRERLKGFLEGLELVEYNNLQEQGRDGSKKIAQYSDIFD